MSTLPRPSTATEAIIHTATVTLTSPLATVNQEFNGADRVIRLAHISELHTVVPAHPNAIFNALVPAPALLGLIPALRDFARQKNPVVLHVALDPLTAADSSAVLAVRDAGCAVVRSNGWQESVDYTVAAGLAAQKLGMPFIHCFAETSNVPEDLRLYDSESIDLNAFLESPQEEEEEEEKEEESQKLVQRTLESALELVGRSQPVVSYKGDPEASVVLVTFGHATTQQNVNKVGVIELRLGRPLCVSAIAGALPSTATHLVALEHVSSSFSESTWGPLLLDLAVALHSSQWPPEKRGALVLADALSAVPLDQYTGEQLGRVAGRALEMASTGRFDAASAAGIATVPSRQPEKPAAREAKDQRPYELLLNEVFGSRLAVVNATDSSTIWGGSGESSVPEYGFGKLAAQARGRQQLAQAVSDVLRRVDASQHLPQELIDQLSVWQSGRNDSKVATAEFSQRLLALLDGCQWDGMARVRGLRSHFALQSSWLVGADSWAYDVGSSGVHHAMASGLNVNMLVLGSDEEAAGRPRKKDIGLYAMNYGSAYVASIAVYTSYAQAVQALDEADAYPGPSIVVAYVPPQGQPFSVSPIEVLQQSKRAVDAGAWPLYRWNPEKEERFQLDSEKLRRAVADFLGRDSALAAVAASEGPRLAGGLDKSVEAARAGRVARKARGDLDALTGALDGPSLLVMFASDGGNAEEAARRVARQGRRRGMAVRCVAMDECEVDELAFEKTVVAVASTAGQGEVPANGRAFARALQTAAINLSETAFAVFGLGDSHYWPRAEDALFYNKPGRDLDRRLAELSARRLAPLGLGDDQDADGWEAGFAAFEQQLWEALNIDVVAAGQAEADDDDDDEPAKRTDEDNKRESSFLRGTIAAAIRDGSTGAVNEWDGKLLKFHGTYMQDDRDVRAERAERGAEKAYSFMIRVRLPGGVATPAQWLAMDRLADEYGNGTMKITTRQTFQLHGVLKRNLRTAMRGINQALMDTIAACGDVNRNVVAAANPRQAHLHGEVWQLARDISVHLLPATTAYHEIWLADTLVAASKPDHEPLYGPAYLPRKFKVAIAIPPENDVDVFAYDLGFIAILDAAQQIAGYNVVVGGGMGMTHNNKKTYPRLASVLGYVPKQHAVAVAEAVMLVQRDHGDRANRKHARLKYTVDDHGLAWWRAQVEQRLQAALAEPRPYSFDRNGDHYGWVETTHGLSNFTMFIQNGRVANLPGSPLKQALAELARAHTGSFRLTCNGHLIVADVARQDKPRIAQLLAKHRLDNLEYSALRLHSMACVALPTCGLAMAESERYLPKLIDLLDAVIDEAGLRQDAIVIRMTGCPNGCARPYNAEIALVGKAPGAYNLYIGGSYSGERLNKIYKESVTEEQIMEALTPIIKQYAVERRDGERFGDFVIRAGVIKETIEGKDFHDV